MTDISQVGRHLYHTALKIRCVLSTILTRPSDDSGGTAFTPKGPPLWLAFKTWNESNFIPDRDEMRQLMHIPRDVGKTFEMEFPQWLHVLWLLSGLLTACFLAITVDSNFVIKRVKL